MVLLLLLSINFNYIYDKNLKNTTKNSLSTLNTFYTITKILRRTTKHYFKSPRGSYEVFYYKVPITIEICNFHYLIIRMILPH
jgi:hypothetical protein